MPESWEIENFLESRENQLHIDGMCVTDLARRYGTPLFIFSERRIKHNIARLRRAQDAIGCPLKICYAAKANSTMAILRVVKDAKCDIEVNSGGELWKALKVGFRGDQIIFNGTSKEVWEIENAIEADIYAIQVDSLYELSLIEETAGRLGNRANVSLRLVPEIETGTLSGLQTALLTSKFGMMPDEALAAFREHKDSPHLNMCGIHLHIGSQNPDARVYSDALGILFETLLKVHDETGTKLEHINLGGGFPVNYLRSDGASPFPREQHEMLTADFEPADALRTAWESLGSSAGSSGLLDDLTILLEPGRSIIADAGVCLTTVRNSKQRPVGDLGPDHTDRDIDHWLLTDAGFNILLSMETYKWYYHLISADRSSSLHDFSYKVAGPLCDGGDVYFDIEGNGRLPDDRCLPVNVQPGEILALLNCGAYSLSQASQYNGRFVAGVVLIRENGEAELVRRRDDFEDLIRNDLW